MLLCIMLPVFKENASEKCTTRKIFKGGAKLPSTEYRNGNILAFYIYCMNNMVLLTKNRSNSKSQSKVKFYFFKLAGYS